MTSLFKAPSLIEKQANENARGWKDDFRKATLFSRMLFLWCAPLVNQLKKRQISFEDLWNLRDQDKCAGLATRLELEWDKEVAIKGNDSNLFRVIMRTFKSEIIIMLLLKLLWLIAVLLTNGLCLSQLLIVLQIFAKEEIAKTNLNQPEFNGSLALVNAGDLYFPIVGIYWAIGFGVGEMLRSLAINSHWMQAVLGGVKASSATRNLVFTHCSKLKKVDSSANAVSIVNLMTNDVSRIGDCFTYMSFAISTPVSLICVVIVGCFVLSYAFAIGIVLLVLFTPMQGKFAKSFQKERKQAIRASDERVNLMSEILRSIKLVKLYHWEHEFTINVEKLRLKELKHINRSGDLKSANNSFSLVFPWFIILVCFAFHTLALGLPLLPSGAFSTVALMTAARFPLGILPLSIRSISEAQVACLRIQKYLLAGTETKDDEIPINPSLENAVEIEKTSFTWEEEFIPTVTIPQLHIPKNKITVLVGALGSGKTSFLSGLVGEMFINKEQEGGKIAMYSNRIAYVSQNPFIFNATIKKNISMKDDNALSEEEEFRLGQVIEACALGPDIIAFPGGLLTEMGERGINGSGGQKARIALARALFSETIDFIILDDIFSAVDASVRIQLFIALKTFAGASKTVLMTTRWMDILPDCDFVMTCHRGIISEAKPFTSYEEVELLTLAGSVNEIGRVFKKSVSMTFMSSSSFSFGPINNNNTMANHDSATGKLVANEETFTGSMRWSTISKYLFRSSWLRLSNAFVLISMSELLLAVAFGLLLSAWTTNRFRKGPDFYAWIMFGIATLTLIIVHFRGVALNTLLLDGSSRIHNEGFFTLMRAKLSYFDTRPMGRIQNLFSSDLDVMEVGLADAVESAVTLLLRTLFSIILVAVIYVYFIIVLFVVIACYLLIYRKYRSALRTMKRIDAQSKVPMLNIVEATQNGLTTLRCYGMLPFYKEAAKQAFDRIAMCALAVNGTNRFIAFRLDFFTCIWAFITAIFVVLFAEEVPPGLAGLALTSIMQTSGILQFGTRNVMEAEAMFSSVERLVNFASNTPMEEDTSEVVANWPTEGKINLENVFVQYRPNLPYVLKDLTLEIRGHCGLVGRSGSGKSSTLLALFRIIDINQGVIRIDGIDIKKIPLEQLRSNLSIIPQDPALFRGTIRSNLDPFSTKSDAEIRQVLELVNLTSFLELETSVNEGGRNMSQGERQLLCYARSLLRNAKVVMVDEGTSSVDYDTSRKISEKVSELFKGKTFISVAHRLDTVINLDMVIVMSAGEVIEKGNPQELVASGQGHFFEMWQHENNTTTEISL